MILKGCFNLATYFVNITNSQHHRTKQDSIMDNILSIPFRKKSISEWKIAKSDTWKMFTYYWIKYANQNQIEQRKYSSSWQMFTWHFLLDNNKLWSLLILEKECKMRFTSKTWSDFFIFSVFQVTHNFKGKECLKICTEPNGLIRNSLNFIVFCLYIVNFGVCVVCYSKE